VFGCGQERPLSADEQAPPSVDWLILGDAPGEAEELQGQPFGGPPGALLDKMLQAVRLRSRLHPDGGNPLGRYNRVFLTSVVKCRPPAGRNPLALELAQCQPYLARQIELLRPKLILALGHLAACAVLGEQLPMAQQTPLGKLRGKVYASRGIPVVVSYTPDYLLRNPLDKAKAWEDLCLAMQASAEQDG
jgi:uracil-DNA glycosylase